MTASVARPCPQTFDPPLILRHEPAGGERRALRITDDCHHDPGSVKWRDEHAATQRRRAIGRRVGIIDREHHAPVGADIGLVLRDWIERRHHVRKALRSGAAGGLALAQLRVSLCQEVAVARQPPHLNAPADGQCLPSEHRTVEGLSASGIGRDLAMVVTSADWPS